MNKSKTSLRKRLYLDSVEIENETLVNKQINNNLISTKSNIPLKSSLSNKNAFNIVNIDENKEIVDISNEKTLETHIKGKIKYIISLFIMIIIFSFIVINDIYQYSVIVSDQYKTGFLMGVLGFIYLIIIINIIYIAYNKKVKSNKKKNSSFVFIFLVPIILLMTICIIFISFYNLYYINNVNTLYLTYISSTPYIIYKIQISSYRVNLSITVFLLMIITKITQSLFSNILNIRKIFLYFFSNLVIITLVMISNIIYNEVEYRLFIIIYILEVFLFVNHNNFSYEVVKLMDKGLLDYNSYIINKEKVESPQNNDSILKKNNQKLASNKLIISNGAN